MIRELGADEKYLAIQELKEKIQTARDAIKHASSDLSRLEDIENKIANVILTKYNHSSRKEDNPYRESDKRNDLKQFNKAQHDIALTTQIMQSHQENIIHWRKQIGEIINSIFL